MSAQETAEAVILVIKRVAKWAAVALLALVLLGVALWGIIWTYQYFDYERPKASVEVVVLRDKCEGDYPFFVGVVNKSSRTIRSYSFSFEVTEKGRSKNLAAYDNYEDDKVITPGDGWGTCWRIKKRTSSYEKTEWITDRDVEVRVTDFRPRFE